LLSNTICFYRYSEAREALVIREDAGLAVEAGVVAAVGRRTLTPPDP
jgi:hypothetical protein